MTRLPISHIDVKLNEVALELDDLEKKIEAEKDSKVLKMLISEFKAKELFYTKLDAKKNEESMLHKNALQSKRNVASSVSEIKINSDMKLIEIRDAAQIKYESIKEYNALLKETKKQILKRDKEMHKLEKESKKLEEACAGGAEKIREMEYKSLGSSLTKGTLGTGAITVGAFFFLPAFVVPCAVITCSFAILKSAHIASKIVADTGGVESTISDFKQLIPQTKGIAKELAGGYLKKRGHQLPQYDERLVG